MISVDSLFYQLIRVSIGTQETLSRLPSEAEWKELFEMAVKQSLVGVCFMGFSRIGTGSDDPSTDSRLENTFARIGMSEELYFNWMGMALQIQMRNEQVNRQCVEVQQMIENAGFRTFIMKGQGNAVLYNSSEDLSLFRQSGDIDIYLDGGFKKVNDFVQRTFPTNEINEIEIHYHCLEDTEVEIHYRPFFMRNPIKNAKLQKFFKETMRFGNKVALPNDVGYINVPTTEFNLVHQMVHIFHHLITEGVGMRQLMDYYFLLCSVKESAENVKRVVHELGLDRFASALMWVLGNVFGMQGEYMLWKLCEEDGRLLLEEIERSGNFGHHDETKANLSNKWSSFWYVNSKTFRFWRFDHWTWFWSPIWRVYHFAWRKLEGFV